MNVSTQNNFREVFEIKQIKDYTLRELQKICSEQDDSCNGCPILGSMNVCKLNDIIHSFSPPVDWDLNNVPIENKAPEPIQTPYPEENLKRIPSLFCNPYDNEDVYFAFFLDDFEKKIKEFGIDNSSLSYPKDLKELLGEYSQPIKFASEDIKKTTYNKFALLFKNLCKGVGIELDGNLTEIAIYNAFEDPLGIQGAEIAVRFTFLNSKMFDAIRMLNERRNMR